MIHSINVICSSDGNILSKLPLTAVLVAISTPGREIAVPGTMRRALHLSFHTLAAELEAAATWRADAAPARPFSSEHASRIVKLLSAVHDGAASHDVFLCESEGLTRCVTVARWAARHYRIGDAAAAVPAGVPACALMLDLLDRCAAQRALTKPYLAPAPRPLPLRQPGHEVSVMGELQ